MFIMEISSMQGLDGNLNLDDNATTVSFMDLLTVISLTLTLFNL